MTMISNPQASALVNQLHLMSKEDPSDRYKIRLEDGGYCVTVVSESVVVCNQWTYDGDKLTFIKGDAKLLSKLYWDCLEDQHNQKKYQ